MKSNIQCQCGLPVKNVPDEHTKAGYKVIYPNRTFVQYYKGVLVYAWCTHGKILVRPKTMQDWLFLANLNNDTHELVIKENSIVCKKCSRYMTINEEENEKGVWVPFDNWGGLQNKKHFSKFRFMSENCIPILNDCDRKVKNGILFCSFCDCPQIGTKDIRYHYNYCKELPRVSTRHKLYECNPIDKIIKRKEELIRSISEHNKELESLDKIIKLRGYRKMYSTW